MPKYKGVYKCKNKKGRYTYYSYVDYKLRRYHVPGGFDTAEQARDARTKYEKELIENDLKYKKDITVQQFAEIYLEEYKNIWRKSTLIGKESIVRQHIVMVLGDKKISEITPFDVQKIRSRLYSRGLEKKYIYTVLNAVKHFFETAMHWEYARKNPAYTLQLPEISRRQKPKIEPIRIVEMIEGIESIREKAAIAIGFYGLLRIGETFGLTWPCIDFRNNLL